MGSFVRKHVSARRRELPSEGRQRFHTNLVYFTELAPMLTGSSLHLISQWIQTVILAQCLALLQRAGLPWAHSHGPREHTQHNTHTFVHKKSFFLGGWGGGLNLLHGSQNQYQSGGLISWSCPQHRNVETVLARQMNFSEIIQLFLKGWVGVDSQRGDMVGYKSKMSINS